MNGTMDIRAIELLVHIVDTGSFRAGAERSGLPRATATRWITDLEAALETRLFERTTRSVRPTDAGLTLYNQARGAIETLHDARRTLEDQRVSPSGTLRVSASLTLGWVLLDDVLDEYARVCPDVRVVVDLNDRFVDLVAEGYDVAVRAGHLRDSTMVARRLAEATHLVCASPSYLAEFGVPEHPIALATHRTLALSSGAGPTVWTFPDAEGALDVTIEPNITVNSFVILARLAARGRGIVRIPSVLVADALRRGELVEVLHVWRPAPSPIQAVYPSARYHSARVRAFIDVLQRVIGQSASSIV